MNSVRMMRNVLSFLPCPPENGFRWRLFELYRRITRFYRRFNSFWARIYTLVGLILLASIFGTVPFGLMRAGVALGFLLFAELLVVAWYGNLWTRAVDWFRTVTRLIRKKGIEKRPLTPSLKEVAEQMGQEITELWIMDGLDNAFSLPMWKVVVFGRPLFERLQENALRAVFAHELAHIKGRHNLLQIFPWLVLWAQLVLWRNLPLPMLVIAGFAFYLLASIPVSWMSELLADRKAASIVGAAAMIEALEALCADEMRTLTETHPSPFGRIKRLRIGSVPRALFAIWIAVLLIGSYAVVFMTV